MVYIVDVAIAISTRVVHKKIPRTLHMLYAET